MILPSFKLEEYFANWEFKAPYLLCMSDAEAWTLNEILETADTESLRHWESLGLGYTETRGHPLLREEIAKLYTKISKDHLLTTAGAEEAIYCAMQALIDEKDHIITLSPCYQSLLSIPQAIANSVTSIELDSENNWELDLERMEEAVRPNTKLIAINYPHNPTGAVLKQDQLEQLIGIARKNDLYLLSDEVYRLMEFDPSIRLPTIADSYEKGISISVMTKAFGLGGLRIGWAASQDQKLLQKIAEYKHYTSICNSAPSEVLAIMALKSKEIMLGRNRKIMLDNLQLLDRFFKENSSIVEWKRPSGSCIGFPKLLLNEPIDHFASRLVEQAGILLLPGSIYNYQGNYFRIGFGRKNFPECLERFEHFLRNV